MNTKNIHEKIYEIRGQKVMLDFDLAQLYEVETRVFNQAVKRNGNRFPEDFMFKLTAEEWENHKGNWTSSQTVMTSGGTEIEMLTVDNQQVNVLSQIVMTSQKSRGKTNLPFAFTEHGVTMLASVLKSEKAVQMSIALVRAFIALKQIVTRQTAISEQLQEIRDRLGEHDVQLNSIYDAIENLLDEKANEKKWEDRPRIGFKR
jgi:phage regulator Rha-like protein